MKALLFFVAMFALVCVAAVWYEVAMWQECRATPHSFWYCLRVLGSHG